MVSCLYKLANRRSVGLFIPNVDIFVYIYIYHLYYVDID